MDHIDVAISQIGVHEQPIGSNWGQDVQKYLNSVGLNTPNSWCMAFVYWCCKEADPNTPLVKTAGVLSQWQKIDPKYKHKFPMETDIFIQDHGYGLGHCGFIESIEGDILHTIEGNSNNDGSRNGYAVVRNKRKTNDARIVGYIRLL